MNQFEEQAKKIGQVHLNTKIQVLKELIQEIENEGYININQVKGSIELHLDSLNKIKQGEEI